MSTSRKLELRLLYFPNSMVSDTNSLTSSSYNYITPGLTLHSSGLYSETIPPKSLTNIGYSINNINEEAKK